MTLLTDWLSREGQYLLSWWLWMSLAGAAALPLCWRLLGGLPDRGYTLARPLGLLLVVVTHWLLASYGFLDNSSGAQVFCGLLVLAFAGYFCWRGGGFSFRDWWRQNRALVLGSEILFAALFFAWALFRAHQPDLYTTEKPMELAFISASLRSPTFPPADPWMSGYAISYYYLGYLMSSALALLSGVSSAIAFSLTNASLFALAGLGAFGVVYNLALTIGRGAAQRWSAFGAGLLALTMLILMGNFQYLLIEAPYQSRAAPPAYFAFWGINERMPPPEFADASTPLPALDFDAGDWSYWWWFRASRVLTDYDLDGNLTVIQPIDEFPAFSFVLSDNHPHVLALPYIVMIIGLMLNLLLLRRPPSTGEVALYGAALGGMAFLNAWDAPIYLVGFVGVDALRRLMSSERGRLEVWDWPGLLKFAIALVAITLVVYLPYFVGFRSQAAGILPNLVFPTYFPRFLVMFGPFLLILGAFLLVEIWRGRATRRFNLRLALQFAAVALVASFGLMALLSAFVSLNDPPLAVAGLGAAPSGGADLLGALLERRLAHSPTALLLLAGMAVALARLLPARRDPVKDGAVAIHWITFSPATGFALLLIAMGAALAFAVEFFYLRDNFGARINTIFKFYYQVWALWSIAGAFAVHSMLVSRGMPRPHIAIRLAIAALVAGSVVAGCAYTVSAAHHRAWIESGRVHAPATDRYKPPPNWLDSIRHVHEGQTVAAGHTLFTRAGLGAGDTPETLQASQAGLILLDGEAVIVQKPLSMAGDLGSLSADDQAVIACLNELVGPGQGVVAEAVRNAYDIQYARSGALAGIPVLLGWENHERQWRGQTYGGIAGSRSDDIRRLYSAPDFATMRDIIARHGITHILFGTTERAQYGSLADDILLETLPAVCEAGQSRVYATARARA